MNRRTFLALPIVTVVLPTANAVIAEGSIPIHCAGAEAHRLQEQSSGLRNFPHALDMRVAFVLG